MVKTGQEALLKFDYNNCLAELVGPEHGLSQADLDEVAARTPEIAARLAAARAAGKLPYRDLPYQAAQLAAIQKSVRAKKGKYANVVVLGIGGSALGTIAVASACVHPFHNLVADKKRKGPRLFVMDNVDPDQFAALVDMIDVKKSLFVVISKSGETAETMSQFLICRARLMRVLGKKYAANGVAITDTAKGYLRPIAAQEGYETFPVPDGVGGRFSVLSPVGLFPLAMIGVKVDRLLAGAAAMDQACLGDNLRENPAFLGAAIQYLFYRKGKPMSVMMPYSQALRDVADWYRQLWAESLGKIRLSGGREEFVGPTPIKSLGVTDQHSQVQLYREGPNDKVFTLIAVEKFAKDLAIPRAFKGSPGTDYLGGHTMAELMDAERRATTFALTKSRRPNVTITVPAVNEFTVGQLLYLLEVQTSFAGELLGIDTYNQPGVEEGKKATFALMGRAGYEETQREIESLKGAADNIV